MNATLRRTWDYARSLAKNVYFWMGLAALLVLAAVLYVLVNNLAMPAYTRHDVAVSVPDVTNEPFESAEQFLRARDLRVEKTTQRFNPELPRGVVVDQNPAPNSSVKPGRRVYLTVNSGERPSVQLPDVRGASLREARNRLQAVGLRADDARLDTVPSQYANTVTRQEPEPGDSLSEGASVTLWYSKGLGETYVTIPDLTGQTADEAQQSLLDQKLRSVVIENASTDPDAPQSEAEPKVVRQSPKPGTRMRTGSEIRLFVGEAEDLGGEEDQDG